VVVFSLFWHFFSPVLTLFHFSGGSGFLSFCHFLSTFWHFWHFLTTFWPKPTPKSDPPPLKSWPLDVCVCIYTLKSWPLDVCVCIYIYISWVKNHPPDFLTGVEILTVFGVGFSDFGMPGHFFLCRVTFSDFWDFWDAVSNFWVFKCRVTFLDAVS